ncbi:hypothetical protein CERZMDRAFT_89682 [Cercospora zeae-maydis SCOH1-5]|uniref:Uncharacterized protein n=1 Tax=Cercospora zeae-maydis SCOH1-5 TaxID=717836 RepID=A0A6A6FT47_9PEZI|nr:hypothetical protein CERZMDRAFT_89682 [Cercospora zeae-maydis SCOH1-5]
MCSFLASALRHCAPSDDWRAPQHAFGLRNRHLDTHHHHPVHSIRRPRGNQRTHFFTSR